MNGPEIIDLFVYPVKSMRGIALQSATLEPEGLAGDRSYMVVRENGRFVTQRDEPRLALIRTDFEGGSIRLGMEGCGAILLPPAPSEGEIIRTRVWNDDCETLNFGDEVSRWLTEALQSEERLRLVCMAPGYTRPQGKPEVLGADTHTRFADAAPYLVTSEASLAELNRNLARRGHAAVGMDRFRPNIVIRGIEAFTEHRLGGFSGPGYVLDFCHPCQRCVITTIDPASATRDPDWQPYKTLRDINPMPGDPRAPAFGQNARLGQRAGAVIRVGDRITPTGENA